MVQKAWMPKEETAGHMASTVRKKRGECWGSVRFLLFITFRIHGMGCPHLGQTDEDSLPYDVNAIG